MEIYTLDSFLRRTSVIDKFESLIWSERFSSLGDFELLINSTTDTRNLLVPNTMLAMNESYRVMVVDTIEDKESSDGIKSLLVKGPSLEKWLLERVAKEVLSGINAVSKGSITLNLTSNEGTSTAHNLITGDQVYFTTTGALPTGLVVNTSYFVIKVSNTVVKFATNYENAIAGTAIDISGTQSGVHTFYWLNNGKWRINDTPANIAREIFQKICVDGILSPSDVIPFITTGNLFPADTIPEVMDSVPFELSVSSVYELIKQICDIYEMGFRLYRNFDNSELKFNIYTGSDRTTSQSTLPPVVFSPDLDNLTNITQLSSVASYKNVAYVFGALGFEIVYAEGADANTAGFDRRVLMVDANDITEPPGANLTALLKQRGIEALAENRSLSAFDGEIPTNGKYKYQVDYFLGDLVEKRDESGVTNQMRVIEQIFVSDKEGDRAYPTLAINLFITPGSWFAWNFNQVWDEADGYWADA